MSSYRLTRDFHRAIGHPVADEPGPIPDDRLRLRLNLIAMEFIELLMALHGHSADDMAIESEKHMMKDLLDDLWANVRVGAPDLVEVARQIADLHVVVSGTALEFGIPEPAVLMEVHAANMRKVGGPKREDGKQLRPEGWEPPDVARVLRNASEVAERRRAQGEL